MSQKLEKVVSSNYYFTNVHLIAVSIMSGGGSVYEAKHCASVLKDFGRRTSAPVYGFGEDALMGAGLVLLTGLNKCYLNKHTLTGELGQAFSTFGYKKVLKKNGIERTTLSEGNLKNRLDPSEDLKLEDDEWVQGILSQRAEEITDSILANRR